MPNRVLMRLVNSGLNLVPISGEVRLQPHERIYLEYVNVIGCNFPTSEVLIVQPINCRFVLSQTDAGGSGPIPSLSDSLYFPLTGANTFERLDPPVLLEGANSIPQLSQFQVFNQGGLAGGLTFTAVYLQFLIQ